MAFEFAKPLHLQGRSFMRVLLIESNRELSDNLTAVLSDRGHEVILVEDPGALRTIGRVTDFDLFVIDVQTDTLDAFAFLEGQNRVGKTGYTLLLSVTDEVKRRAEDLGIGPEQCIANPNNRLALLAALRTIEATHNENAEQQKVKDPVPQSPAEPEGSSDRKPEPGWGLRRPQGQIVVLASHKGGTGKTTLAMHLITGLLQQGLKVASFDLDHPQHSLTRYLENRRAYVDKHGLKIPFPFHQSPSVPTNDLEILQRDIKEHRRMMNVVVIDCPAGYSMASRTAIGLADTLITPINDSFVDLDLLAVIEPDTLEFRRLGPFAQVVDEVRQRRRQWKVSDIDWIVLRNRLSTIRAQNKERMADALGRLASRLAFRSGPGLSERVLYRELFLEGTTLLDLREEGLESRLNLSHVAARQEMRRLLDLLDSGTEPETKSPFAASA
jgi:chromosome partitioning protein